MQAIIFNALSSLGKELKKKNMEYANTVIRIKQSSTADDLISQIGFKDEQVESVYINSRIVPNNTIINDRDRVAFVPSYTMGRDKKLHGFEHLKTLIRNHKTKS